MGLITLASNGLQLISYIKATQDSGLKATSTDKEYVLASSLSPTTLVWFTICAAGISIAASLVFTVLDLVGMIVLRSRMWQHIAKMSGGLDGMSDAKLYPWDTYTNNCASASSGNGVGSGIGNGNGGGVGRGAEGCGEWWGLPVGGKGYDYSMDTRRSLVRWWQQWVFLEELVFSIQRNIATIRLAISVFLALTWSSSLIQLIVIAVAGKCHIGGSDVQLSNGTEKVCVLLRQGMVGSVISWACWALVSIVLIFVNTRSQCLRTRINMSHSLVGAPLPGLDFGIGPAIPAGPYQGGKHFSMPRMLGHMQPSYSQQQQPYQQNQQSWHPSISLPIPNTTPMQMSMSMSMPVQAQTRAPSNVTGYHRKPAKGQLRSSWSQFDDESIMTDSRSDGQSILDSKSHMLFQLYHLQNQQFQSLHQFQPPSRISEERLAHQMGQRTTKRNSHLADLYANGAVLEDVQLHEAKQQQQNRKDAAVDRGSQSLASFGGIDGNARISSKRRTIG
ncbi:hypothetical protein LPJ56_003553 [Coemansia sp. RSA 2599]|nr:hypothetical protein LPJ56_003553 [Coemansia sp. RSA 2599]